MDPIGKRKCFNRQEKTQHQEKDRQDITQGKRKPKETIIQTIRNTGYTPKVIKGMSGGNRLLSPIARVSGFERTRLNKNTKENTTRKQGLSFGFYG